MAYVIRIGIFIQYAAYIVTIMTACRILASFNIFWLLMMHIKMCFLRITLKYSASTTLTHYILLLG